MEPFDVQIDITEAWIVATLAGHVACDTELPLRDALAPILEGDSAQVVLDLAQMDFINSLALGVLIELSNELHARGGQLRLAGANPHISGIFLRTRLAEVFPMYDTAAHAVGQ